MALTAQPVLRVPQVLPVLPVQMALTVLMAQPVPQVLPVPPVLPVQMALTVLMVL